MAVLYWAIVIVAAYLLGSVNGSIIVSKSAFHEDIRTKGSGNAGLTNFYRNYGMKAFLWVVVIDVLKAVVSGLFAGWLMSRAGFDCMLAQEVSMLFVVVGHMFPVFFGFRGGKGILTSVGGIVVFDWRIIAILLGIFFLMVILTRFVSLGSLCAAFAYPFMVALFHGGLWPILVAAVTGLLIIYKHKDNIDRLVRGEESKFTFHRQK